MTIRIMLVDDSAAFVGAARRCLEANAGLAVVGTARTGHEAVAEVERVRPDLVVMDLAMPDLDGIEATRRIKRRPDAPRIIVATLHDSAEHRAAVSAAQADGFVSKAEFASSVIPMIRRLFDGTGG